MAASTLPRAPAYVCTDTVNEDGIPLVSKQPVTVDFIEHRISEFRDSRGNLPCRWNVDQEKFVAKQLREQESDIPLELFEEEIRKSKMQLTATNESFSYALDKLKAESKDKSIALLDLNACHDWEEVAKALEKLTESYHDDKSTWAKVRKIFRNVGDNSKSIQSFVHLLPDGQYKTLTGGLTLILTAMLKHSEVREKFAELLQELPDIVDECEQYGKLYSGRNTIQLCVNEVYLRLLQALDDVARWMMQKSSKRMRDSLLQNTSYGQSFDLSLKSLRMAKQSLTRQTNLYQAWQTRATLHIAYENLETSQNTLSSVKTMNANITDSRREIATGLNELKDFLGDISKNADWAREKDEEVARLRKALERGKLDHEEKDRRISDLISHRDRNTLAPVTIMKDLDLNINRDTHLHEFIAVQRHGLQEGINFQNRARWVSSSAVFQDWINSSNSAVLFIQGRGSFQRTSPLSFLVSLLCDNLRDQPGVLVVPFFCGRRSADPGETGPMAMARAFFVQMLALYDATHPENASESPMMNFLEAQHIMRMKEYSIEAYLTAIRELILKLRQHLKAVFVLIDGIDFFDGEWNDEVLEFIDGIGKVVSKARKRVGGPVKVLLTASPSRSRCFTARSQTGILLDVPEDMSGERNGLEKLSHKV